MLESSLGIWGYRTQIAEWASILALVASVYAAIQITRVTSRVLGRVRLPELVPHIERNGTKLMELLNNEFDQNRLLFGAELAMLETNLKAVKRSTTGSPRKSAKILLYKINRFKYSTYFGFVKRQNSRDDAWEIYEKISPIVMELNRAIEDQRRGA